jgi:hypothetical protein
MEFLHPVEATVLNYGINVLLYLGVVITCVCLAIILFSVGTFMSSKDRWRALVAHESIEKSEASNANNSHVTFWRRLLGPLRSLTFKNSISKEYQMFTDSATPFRRRVFVS